MKIKKFAVLISVFAFIFLTSCTETQPDIEGSTEYRYVPSDEQTSGENGGNGFSVDASWQKNFSVEYEYFNPEQSGVSIKVKEIKGEKGFVVENPGQGTTLFYKPASDGIDYYIISEADKKAVCTKLRGKSFAALSSLFMKLSAVDAGLPSRRNVLYMYDEEVAGRTCRKYIERAYDGGTLTQTVYVWVDAQFGFAAKCESYDAENKLSLMWEVKNFSAGSVKDSDVLIDLGEYNVIFEGGE